MTFALAFKVKDKSETNDIASKLQNCTSVMKLSSLSKSILLTNFSETYKKFYSRFLLHVDMLNTAEWQ